MPGGWYDAKIIHQVDWAEGLRSIRLDRTLDFSPGQFTNLALTIGGQRVKRAFSMASASGAELEFYLTRIPGGALSEPIFELGVGDPLLVEGTAYGLLTLDHVPDFARDLWFLSTGTGLAPFLSMLRSNVLLPRFENVLVVNGARFEKHLAYGDELAEIAGNSGGRIQVRGMVTREPPKGNALEGRLTNALSDGRLERTFGVPFDPARSHFMLCGNPEMITEATERLAAFGMKRHRRREPGHISIEKYW